jgi:hypothetical protein
MKCTIESTPGGCKQIITNEAPGYRNIGTPEHRNTGTPEHRNTGPLGHSRFWPQGALCPAHSAQLPEVRHQTALPDPSASLAAASRRGNAFAFGIPGSARLASAALDHAEPPCASRPAAPAAVLYRPRSPWVRRVVGIGNGISVRSSPRALLAGPNTSAWRPWWRRGGGMIPTHRRSADLVRRVRAPDDRLGERSGQPGAAARRCR